MVPGVSPGVCRPAGDGFALPPAAYYIVNSLLLGCNNVTTVSTVP